mmetsp:Transcript_16814/g.25274  ORF Transcript_16814/g.25274 Transcript_16814/m.25274 type:complete len:177 (-) Transcript_16814:73-603(-)
MSDTLEIRVDRLHQLLLGNRRKLQESLDMKQRLEDLQNKIDNTYQIIPNMKVCSELVSKIGPALFRQKFSLSQTEDKVLSLLNERDSILRSVQYLQEIERLDPAVNQPFLQDIPSCATRLQAIDNKISALTDRLQAQTKDLDEFVDIYHTLVETLSLEFSRLDNKLTLIEKKKSMV